MVCEGQTEKQYFRGFRERNSGFELETVTPSYTNPQGLVKDARRRATREGLDQVWVVFDTENVNLAEARRLADQCGDGYVRTLVSHPSFEIWLLLHLLEHSEVRGCWDAASSERKLKAVLPRWSKGDGTRFEDFAAGVLDACARAQRLGPVNAENCPSTDVYRFVHAKNSGFPDAEG